MRISELFAAIACVVPVLAGGEAFAQPKTTVVLGTATPGGGFPVYGAPVLEVRRKMAVFYFRAGGFDAGE